MEKILTVDEKDNVIGAEDKERCHDGDGILHRAFLAMMLDNEGLVVLARRSEKKRLWPGYWDGTVASHVCEGEDYVSSTKRRVREEVGISPEEIEYLFKFRYQVAYEKEGSENEICAVTLIRNIDTAELKPDRNEISELKLITPDLLRTEIREKPGLYAPWLILALEEMERRELSIFSPALSR